MIDVYRETQKFFSSEKLGFAHSQHRGIGTLLLSNIFGLSVALALCTYVFKYVCINLKVFWELKKNQMPYML